MKTHGDETVYEMNLEVFQFLYLVSWFCLGACFLHEHCTFRYELIYAWLLTIYLPMVFLNELGKEVKNLVYCMNNLHLCSIVMLQSCWVWLVEGWCKILPCDLYFWVEGKVGGILKCYLFVGLWKYEKKYEKQWR